MAPTTPPTELPDPAPALETRSRSSQDSGALGMWMRTSAMAFMVLAFYVLSFGPVMALTGSSVIVPDRMLPPKPYVRELLGPTRPPWLMGALCLLYSPLRFTSHYYCSAGYVMASYAVYCGADTYDYDTIPVD